MPFLLSLKFYLLVDSFLLNVGCSDPFYPTVKTPETKNQPTNSKASQLPPKRKSFSYIVLFLLIVNILFSNIVLCVYKECELIWACKGLWFIATPVSWGEVTI